VTVQIEAKGRDDATQTCLIVDVDGTLAQADAGLPYDQRRPCRDVIARVNDLHSRGVQIVIYSARNMRTYKGNMGLINLHTLPVLVAWLQCHGVRYHEIHMGKPWCGTDGLYVRSNGIRPDQFVSRTLEDIEAILTICAEPREALNNGV
jgi:capsule biosynthesis phosphatase